MSETRKLKVFLCHSSGDKQAVRSLYGHLKRDGFDPWLDEEDLLPGQDWEFEISNAVRNTDVVVVCLSQGSVTKMGYVQREIKSALDVADQQPEGTIFIIPVKLEECGVPNRLNRWQWVNLFDNRGYDKLIAALNKRAAGLGISPGRDPNAQSTPNSIARLEPAASTSTATRQLDVKIEYEEVLISGHLHRYRLHAVVTNNSLIDIDNYWIELSFPKVVIDEGGVIWGELKERETQTHRFFRLTSKDV